ncbi:MAG: SGNH/GDSL hydrolase family protein, partial [Erysipelotrichaceae bacterium]|nr:SGNH/GDSL hydrolase family protein [Erysipelotrichaceae bacterium]
MSFQKKIEHFILKYLAVPKTPKYLEGKRHIACIGDSITFGAGVNGKKEETWEHFLNHRLGDDFQVLNYGISGRTLQDEGDYPYKADKFYAISKSHP